jgi:hypothetical protein
LALIAGERSQSRVDPRNRTRRRDAVKGISTIDFAVPAAARIRNKSSFEPRDDDAIFLAGISGTAATTMRLAMNIDEKTAARLAADQERFRAAQSERWKKLGVIVVWTGRQEFMTAHRKWEWGDGSEIDKTAFADWRYTVKGDQIVVTRTEFGFLKLPDESQP